ncbi:hypothetical protein K439DRAFT_1644149 [Ramaria rubella]|nr:hypothetical protein K439DRAFT_1644149 [Ramaria rubella]
MTRSDKEVLFATLEAQGQEFLKTFMDNGTKRKRTGNREDTELSRNVRHKISTYHSGEVEAWTGFASSEDGDSNHDVTIYESSGAPTIDMHETRRPNVVVFAEGAAVTRIPAATKTQGRTFMSSKVSKLRHSPVEAKHTLPDKQEIESEASNTRNDALLHRLVHTQLLSGSLNPDLNLAPARQRKALAGRVLELADASKLGKGESTVRDDEKKKASKRVRDGMVAKQKEKDAKSLNEAKNAGNYHPALKKLFAASSGSTKSHTRDRGLRMGIGKFSNGMLKLSSEEIGSIRDVRTTRGRGKAGRAGRGGRGNRGGRGSG